MKFELPFKNIHRLMRKNTNQRINKESVYQIIIFYETLTEEIMYHADLYSKHDKRNTINSRDIQLAIKTIFNQKVE